LPRVLFHPKIAELPLMVADKGASKLSGFLAIHLLGDVISKWPYCLISFNQRPSTLISGFSNAEFLVHRDATVTRQIILS
jgi:hypothetical protein